MKTNNNNRENMNAQVMNPTPANASGRHAGMSWKIDAENGVIITGNRWNCHTFEIVTEWPAGYYVWNIGRHNFPIGQWLPLCKDGAQKNTIDTDHLKAIKVDSEAAALACLDAAAHGTAKTREDYLRIIADVKANEQPRRPADRLKSSADLYDQWNRIFDALALRDWDETRHDYRGEMDARIDYITNVLEHYQKNIRDHFNRYDYLSNREHFTKLGREIYAKK